jgi:hypothetical protein
LFRTPYDEGYYSAFVDSHGILGVEDPKWRVTVWENVDGRLEERARVEGPAAPPPASAAPVAPPPAHAPPPVVRVTRKDDDDDDDDGPFWRGRRRIWGMVSVGTVFTPFVTEGDIRLPQRRVIANQADGWAGPLRGLDMRWHGYRLRRSGRAKYPRSQWYFRTGYTQGHLDFLPEDPMAGFNSGNAQALDYLTVPLFLAGNIYLFDRFPLRPYAGMGAGFDVLRVQYQRFGMGDKVDTSARIGFELHAGIEVRITNYVVLSAEIMQLWSARRKLDAVPDYSNEGFTIVSSVGVGFPLRDRERGRHHGSERRHSPASPPVRVERLQGPSGENLRVRVDAAGTTTVIESAPVEGSGGTNATAAGPSGSPAAPAPSPPREAPPEQPGPSGVLPR